MIFTSRDGFERMEDMHGVEVLKYLRIECFFCRMYNQTSEFGLNLIRPPTPLPLLKKVKKPREQ